MKVRSGFVSNSSSSSFIVALPERVEDLGFDALKSLLFGDESERKSLYNENVYTTEEMARSVYDAMQMYDPFSDITIENTSKAVEEITSGSVEEITSGWFEGRPEVPMYIYQWTGAKLAIAMEVIQAVEDRMAEKLAIEFERSAWMQYGKMPVYYVIEYGDHSDFGCLMEHGDIFANVPHIRISHH